MIPGLVYSFFLFLLIVPKSLPSQVVESSQIEWKKIQEASGYQVQIQNEKGKTIVEDKVPQNYYPIQNLKPGKYKIRIGVLSPFGKVVVWSAWRDFEIRAKEEPIEDKKIANAQQQPKPVQNATIPTIPIQEKIQEKKEESFLPPPQQESRMVSVNRGCGSTNLPKEIVKECYPDYIILDLSTPEKIRIYNQYLLNSQNRASRIRASIYYQENCKQASEEILKILQRILESQAPQYDMKEKEEHRKALDRIQNCPPKRD